MEDHYNTLGLNPSATAEEIRRAYRVLARRYHPDVNPGKDSNEKFKEIAQAYKILSDAQLKKNYDLDYEKAHRKLAEQRLRSYSQQARAKFEATHRERMAQAARAKAFSSAKKDAPKEKSFSKRPEHSIADHIKNTLNKKLSFTLPWQKKKTGTEAHTGSLSLIEVSLTVPDAIQGVKKTIEVPYKDKTRKLSVTIPAGVRTGSVIRMRSKSVPGEELVLIIQLASHPFLTIERKGLVVDLPVTITEASLGAQIEVPTLEDSQMLKIPAGSQTGTQLRIKEHGMKERDDKRGDIFYRLLIQAPQDSSGLSKKLIELEPHYKGGVRQALPTKLI